MPTPEASGRTLRPRRRVSAGDPRSCVPFLWSNPQFNPKTAASIRLGFHSNFATHTLDNFANNCEANASALVFSVELLEHRKQARLRVLRNSDPVILNPNSRKAG